MRFDVTMEQPGGVHGRHGITQLDADGCGFRDGEDSARLERVFERLAVDELHPQADAVFDLFRAVDGDNVRVANARKQTAFVNDRSRVPAAGDGAGRQKLERDFAVEACIPGAVDPPERTAADRLQHSQRSPLVERREIVAAGGRLGRRSRRRIRKPTMKIRER